MYPLKVNELNKYEKIIIIKKLVCMSLFLFHLWKCSRLEQWHHGGGSLGYGKIIFVTKLLEDPNDYFTTSPQQ